MIRKLTFNAANVTSNDDSVLYKVLGAGDRILKGCTITNSENEIYIGAGYISVYGRQLKVEGTETVEVPAAVVATPYSLVLEIDMDNDTQEFKAITSEPVQDDISGGTGVYQMLLGTFSMGLSGIEELIITIPRGDIKSILPSIFVKGDVLSTDTVYATKGLKVASSIWVTIEGTSGFLISDIDELGTWTVTVKRGTLEKNHEILIDAVAQFEILHFFYRYLIRGGQYVEEWVTKAWGQSGSTGEVKAPTVEQLENTLKISHNANSQSAIMQGQLFLKQLIDVTPYSKMVIKTKSASRTITRSDGGGSVTFGITTAIADHFTIAPNGTIMPWGTNITYGERTLELDISQVSGNKAILIQFYAAVTNQIVEIEDIYLEE